MVGRGSESATLIAAVLVREGAGVRRADVSRRGSSRRRVPAASRMPAPDRGGTTPPIEERSDRERTVAPAAALGGDADQDADRQPAREHEAAAVAEEGERD